MHEVYATGNKNQNRLIQFLFSSIIKCMVNIQYIRTHIEHICINDVRKTYVFATHSNSLLGQVYFLSISFLKIRFFYIFKTDKENNITKRFHFFFTITALPVLRYFVLRTQMSLMTPSLAK